jgi:PKD repeat protein
MKKFRLLLGLLLALVVPVTSAAILCFLLLSCGNSHDQSSNPGLTQSNQEYAVRSLSIEKAIEEASAYNPPLNLKINSETLETLKNELVRQLKSRLNLSYESRITSTAPTGDAGRVTNLMYNSESGVLHWTYVNVGDYDCSGEVGVPDITPIAQYYLAQITTPGSLEDWIDGDNSGEVGISDITPIAQGYLNAVKNYRFVTSDTENGEFTPVGNLIDFGVTGVIPKFYNTPCPEGALSFIAVEPLDASGTPGERSNVISLVDTPPSIIGVSPLGGVTGTDVQFTAEATGSNPFTYEWSFGGGATPDTSTEASPTVTLGAINDYNASVTVTNSHGSDTFDFIVSVTETAAPPEITLVTPLAGGTGRPVQFTPTVNGTPPFTYDWDFGGGAAPDASSDASPTVTLGAVGSYSASLTVTNSYGSDTYDWSLGIGNPPSISDVTPIAGTTGEDDTFGATVSGDSPMTYSWNFGGGSAPNTSSSASPTVTLSSTAGSYDAVLTVSNAYGLDTFPFTLTVDPVSSDGYTLYCPFTNSTSTYLIDMDGSVVHTWTSDYPPGACAKLRPNGNLLRLANIGNTTFGNGKAGRIEETDWDNNMVWSYDVSTTKECSHHDFWIMPNGNILLNLWNAYTKPEAVAAGRNPAFVKNGGVWMVKVIEVEPVLPDGGNIVWEWNSFDHMVQNFDDTKPNYGDPAAHPELLDFNYNTAGDVDWLHTNSVAYNDDLDQIIITVHGLSEMWVIDHSTTTAEAATHAGGIYNKGGDFLYRWGNPQVYGAGTIDDQKLFWPHNAHWIADDLPGAGNILIFNNTASNPAGMFSAVVEITPPVNPDGSYTLTGSAYGPVDPSWIYMATPKTQFYSQNMSGAQRLPGGNTLICSAQQMWIFEVTPAGELVWDFTNPYPAGNPGTVFTALRYPYDYPGFDNMP